MMWRCFHSGLWKCQPSSSCFNSRAWETWFLAFQAGVRSASPPEHEMMRGHACIQQMFFQSLNCVVFSLLFLSAPQKGLLNQRGWWFSSTKTSCCQCWCRHVEKPNLFKLPYAWPYKQAPLMPFVCPMECVCPIPPSFLPFIVLVSEGDREENGPSCAELAFKMLLRDARSSAACHKLFIFSIIHAMSSFISDPF